ncbi:MAG TPA: hypothetical protein DDY52_02240 [Candidatus Moranbacteria bacterium]|nr:MAG: LD-carboxypeptidase [Candidatus Moranbacteria bacterium GW2011_GWF1_34_10]HBI16954.1 hypothetical protein [Candidatus Moranbacteria bacterium]
MNRFVLKKGDTIGVIAPSRPIWNIQEEIEVGLDRLRKNGFVIKKGANLGKHFYYSAGSKEERVEDLHAMFIDEEVKAIICATGGASSIDLLKDIDFDIIKKNPKPFIGYSDITILLLAIEKNINKIAIHGPNVYELSKIDENSFSQFLGVLENSQKANIFSEDIKVIKHGKASGKILGGNITLINSLLATKLLPNFDDKILFWEEIGMAPAMLSFKLRELELSGKIKNIKGMIIGSLSDCDDNKYPQDNRGIEEIVSDVFLNYDFPIIQWNHFGHDISNFYSFSFDMTCEIDTEKKKITLQ